MVQHSLDVNGIPMRWLEHGQGTPVVLVHGIPTSPLLWRKVLPLVPGARLLAWEMVGYGDSIEAGKERDISVTKQAEYLLSFMHALGLEPAVLVGHDLGGGVVQIAALSERARCAGLVLTSAIGYDSWPVAPVLLPAKLGTVVGRTPTWLFRPNFAAIVAAGYSDPGVARECTDLHFAKYAAHGGAEAFVRQARALHTRDTLAIQERLPELRGVPARVVWGEADPFQKLRYGKRLAADLGCPLEVIPGARHFLPEEHPQPLAQAISEVLREVRQHS